MTQHTPESLDALYRDVFEVDKRGAAIFDDLCARFAKGPARGFDAAAVNETFARAHQREVVDYILRRINRANGAPEPVSDHDAG